MSKEAIAPQQIVDVLEDTPASSAKTKKEADDDSDQQDQRGNPKT